MKKIALFLLAAGIVLGGYSCDRSADRTGERLGTEESESVLDPMEQDIVAEAEGMGISGEDTAVPDDLE